MSGIGDLFSGNTPKVDFTPRGFTNPTGFGVSGGGKVSQSPVLAGNIGNLQSTLLNAGSAFGAFGATVKPGFSQFRLAGLQDIANQFRSSRSNLRDTLAQRRVLGSSFANSQFSQSAADEAQAKSNFEASSYLQELQASMETTQAQYNANTQAYTTAINQANIETATAAQLTNTNNQIMASVAEQNANLKMSMIGAQGSVLGSLIGAGAGIATGGLSYLGSSNIASAILQAGKAPAAPA